MEQAGKDMAIIGKRLHALTHSKTYEKLLCELHEAPDGLTDVQRKGIDSLYESYSKNKNISAKFSYEISI